MIGCLTSARFTMNAEILSWQGMEEGTVDNVTEGIWETYQDPTTFEILNRWVSTNSVGATVLTGAPTARTFSCIARAIVDGGIRVAGTTERFGDTYENIDYVKMWLPGDVVITKRDRITNIRAKKGGRVLWVDEEYSDGTRPTVFNVNGVAPLFDAFNVHKENFALLGRID